MSERSFDLTREGWIRCSRPDGSGADELSLRDALVHAHDLGGIADSSPLVRVALLRLLLAVLYRVCEAPASLEQWRQVYQAARFDPALIDAYLDRWRDRFDLFHPTRPFFQVVDATAATGPVTRLRHELASGNNTTLFDHTTDANPPAFTAAEAGRSLVTTQAFALGGGKSEPFYLCDAPLARGFTVMAEGRTLFETLSLNLLPRTADAPLPDGGNDRPAWEYDGPRNADHAGTVPLGYLDYLTWQPRAVRLAPGPDGTTTACAFHQHLRLPDGFHQDPFVVYRQDKNRGWVPRRLHAGRPLWRDSEAILSDSLGRTASILSWLRDLTAVQGHRAHRLSLVGIGSPGQAKIDFWLSETLPVADLYLTDPDLRALLGQALALTEQAARELRNAVRTLAKELGIRADAVDAFVRAQRTEQRFWPRLEQPFHLLLARLADAWEGGDPERASEPLAGWRDAVIGTALTALEEITRAYGTTARELRAAALARRHARFLHVLSAKERAAA